LIDLVYRRYIKRGESRATTTTRRRMWRLVEPEEVARVLGAGNEGRAPHERGISSAAIVRAWTLAGVKILGTIPGRTHGFPCKLRVKYL
jgi:hypothetical protein